MFLYRLKGLSSVLGAVLAVSCVSEAVSHNRLALAPAGLAPARVAKLLLAFSQARDFVLQALHLRVTALDCLRPCRRKHESDSHGSLPLVRFSELV